MRRILVVDDDLHVGQPIGIGLKPHGFRVSTADGGATGLAALDNATFDLMIVDVFMPHMKGFEAIRLFHARPPAVPLIAISGYAFSGTESSGSEFLKLATRLGATRCLRKPSKPATPLAVIDERLTEAEPYRRQVATPGAVADSLFELQPKQSASDPGMEAPHEPRRFGGRLS
jgi:CheY-like chemotaxis protein